MNRATFLASSGAFAAAHTLGAGSSFATVPMQVRDNRALVEIAIGRTAANARRVWTLFDTGGGAFVVARDLADSLGFAVGGKPRGEFIGLRPVPEAFAGSVRLPIPGGQAYTSVSHRAEALFASNLQADFPVSLLYEHAVTFDYPGSRFSLDGPAIDGEDIPVGIDAQSRMPRVELEIGGERLGFLLDTGASFSMLSQAVIDHLRARNPRWRWVKGAYGPANMMGWQMEAGSTMLAVENVRLGAFAPQVMNVVSRPAGTYERWMSAMMSGPVVGSIGGNVLRNFTFRLDYPKQRLVMRYAATPFKNELCMVPVTLQRRPSDGAFSIAAALSPATPLVGMQLLAVDGTAVTGLSIFAVQQLLRGDAGSLHHLRVRRSGSKVHEVVLPAVAIL